MASSPCRHKTMPRAYSDDLRCKILQAYERAEVGLEQVANQFGVSYGFTKKIRRQQLQSGQMERPAQRVHGPASRVTEPVQQFLRMQLQQQPDLTLAELGQGLQQSLHVGLSKTRLCLELQRMRLRRKKIPPRPRTRERGRPPPSSVVVGADHSDRSPPPGLCGRERSHHGDDPSLRTCAAWRTGARRRSGRALAHSHPAGCDHRRRSTRDHDHRIAHRWRGFSCLVRLQRKWDC